MPISLSAKKAARKSVKNRKANLLTKRRVKSTAKDYLRQPSADKLQRVFSVLDKAAKSNVLHNNKVARLKSRYSKKLFPQTKSVAV